ncbi:MAG: chitobiase/beta-hexosaminidase C-terminal domain-containing protein [Bacteroidales bacterium]|nr:chitobiase/beta-hexosaminidase C-terminal domain-containing protein [Bacteroidales bacterium]
MMKKYKNILSVAAMAAMVFFSFAGAQAQTSHVTIGGSVFGGGNMAAVGKGTTVLIDQADAQITGDVYGGGALAEVDTTRKSNPFTTLGALQAGDSIVVTILQGSIGRDVYGGGLGNAGTAANVYGPVFVNIGTLDGDDTLGSATINGMVFGGNNINGTPKDSIHVNIWKTARGGAKEVGSFTEEGFLAHIRDNASAHSASSFALQAVYGGSNKADYVPVAGKGAKVWVHGCSNTVKMLYGGGRAAAVGSAVTNAPAVDSITANTFVIVDGGRIDTLFAGGDGHTTDGSGNYLPADIHGNVNAHVRGGLHTAVFGASNTAGSITGNKDITIDKSGPCETNPEAIGTLFGGGNMADAQGNLSLTVECGAGYFNEIYGGCNLADVINGNVVLTIKGGHIGNVYGGSKGVKQVGTEGQQGYVAPVAADIYGSVTLNLYGGTMENAFGGSNQNGNIDSTITVNVLNHEGTCGLNITNNLYGAGNVTPYTPSKLTKGAHSPVVNVIHVGTSGSIGGSVYGGAKGDGATVTADPIVNFGYDTTTMASLDGVVYPDASIPDRDNYRVVATGNVYGGGDAAVTNGSATVFMYKSNSQATEVFGGGNAADVDSAASVTISDGTVTAGLYGGCNTSGTVGGNITVTVNSGTIGTNDAIYNDGIFGGGYGAGTSTDSNVTVNINGGTIYGDVYGGSSLGSVNNNVGNDVTTVNILSGTVNGTVFGGGLGDNSNAAQVNGEIVVNIGQDNGDGTYDGDATITGNIYGCNNTNGSPQKDVTVNIYSTARTSGVNEVADAGYAIANVFGGGKNADFSATGKTATVNVYSCDNTIGRIFGGGDAAAVPGAAVMINGGRIDTVFGGGNGEVVNTHADVGAGGITLNLHGGKIGMIISASNQRGTIGGSINVTADNSSGCDEEVTDFFGGANQVDIGTNEHPVDVVTTIECGAGTFTNVYGGSNQANIIGNVVLNVKGGTMENVYGGSKGVENGTAANITGNVTLNLYGGTISQDAFGGSNQNGSISGNITVNVLDHEGTCALDVNNIYGGGNVTPYAPTSSSATSPTINVMHIKQLAGIRGNVYGGGKGSTAVVTAQPRVNIGYVAASMSNLSTVEYPAGIDPTTYVAKVTGSVFGGGNAAAVNGSPIVTMDKINSQVGDLYGGGNAAGITGSTTVTMNNGRVTDGIYGGCNTSGTVTGNSTVDLLGGTIGTSSHNARIFGGGFGQTTNVDGNVHITFGNEAGTATPTLNGDLYGGSALGKVNTKTASIVRDNMNSVETTTIDILSGTINGNVFGGGLGEKNGIDGGTRNIAAIVHGKIQVKIGKDNGDGTYSGSAKLQNATIYGCNNVNGTPENDVYIDVYRTYLRPTDSVSNGITEDATFAIGNVYGGGNRADYAPTNKYRGNLTDINDYLTSQSIVPDDSTRRPFVKKPHVFVHGCANTIMELYGGGNAAAVPGDSVVFDGGRYDLVFGGGNGALSPADVGVGGVFLVSKAGLCGFIYQHCNRRGAVTGSVTVTKGGSCCNCNNDTLVVFNHFCGGNEVDILGNFNYKFTCGGVGDYGSKQYNALYGGCRLGTTYGNITLTIEGGTFGTIYGGPRGDKGYAASVKKFPATLAEMIQDTVDHPDVNDRKYNKAMIDFMKANPSLHGTGGNVTIILKGGTVGTVYGGCDVNGNVEGRITIIVDSTGDACPLDVNTIYGGGNLASYSPDTANSSKPYYNANYQYPFIDLQNGHVNRNVYGGGKGSLASLNNGKVTSNPYVHMHPDVANSKKFRVGGDIYGGGELGQVQGNTKVLIESGVVKYNVYGAGLGDNEDEGFGLVAGNTWVDMQGGQVEHSVYGGGKLASVGNFTAFYTAGDVNNDPRHVVGEPKTCQAGTGVAKVTLSGDAQVGITDPNVMNPTDPDQDDCGYIFGGSSGELDSIHYPSASRSAFVDSTYLEIGGNAFVTASVYGGCENGQVLRNTYVKITGNCQIGVGYHYENGNHVFDAMYTTEQWNSAIANPLAAASNFHECYHWPYHLPYAFYDPYATYEHNGSYYYDAEHTQSANGGSVNASNGHSFYGNVFGGGCGYYAIEPDGVDVPFGTWRRAAGRVNGNTRVDVTGGHILTNLYGGNEMTDVLGSCTVNFSDGTLGVPRTVDSIRAHPVTCYLFGAGKGDTRTIFNKNTNVGSVSVNVTGGRIFGSIFGGGEDGHVMGNVEVNIDLPSNDDKIGTTGTSYVDGNVFGGGRGFTGNALTAGNVGGNITVNISRGTVLGSVYGGGRMGSVGYDLCNTDEECYGVMTTDPARGNITVNITGGTIGNDVSTDYSLDHPRGGNVFGGPMGRLVKLNDEYILPLWSKLGSARQTTVNISGGTIKSNVYGGSELGSVTGNTYVNISDSAVIGVSGRNHGNVYGGGYGHAELTGTDATQAGDAANSVPVFAGRTYGNTAVSIYGNAILYGDVYGGGEMASVGNESYYDTTGNTLVNIGTGTVNEETGFATSVAGNATIIGGDVYGANNISGTPLGNTEVNIYSTARTAKQAASYTEADREYAIANVFGGGNRADYQPGPTDRAASVHVYTCDNTIEDLFGGGNAAAAYGTAVTIDGGRFGRVFGGGNGEDTPADIGLGGTNTIINAGKIHQLFGGSNERGSLGGPVRTRLAHKGTCEENIDEFYAGSNEAQIIGDIVTIIDCNPEKTGDVDEFYGGCNKTDVYGNVTLIINGGHYGRLFGGSKGSNSIAADIKRYDETHHPAGRTDLIGTGGNVNLYIYGGTIGSAFGGSDTNGNIEGAINVYVNDTSTNCPLNLDYVYGGGNLATNAVVDATITSPYVHLLNGIVDSNVYGGGRGTLDNIEKGRTTANAKVEMNPTGDQHFWVKGNIYGGGELAYVGGNDTVIINGGKVGPYAPAAGTTRYTLKGCVYGGGLGKPGSTYANFARVGGNTVVSIGANTDTIHGSVFGGGEDGQVLGNTSVTVAGGVIGVPTKYTGDLSELNTYVGNVYGGGRGIDLDASGYLTATAGMVGGNTAVTISGGHVCRSVYGGGSIASVGRDGGVGFKPFDNTKGGTSVTVTGGLIGVYAAPTDNGANANPRYTVNPNATYGSVYGGGRGLPGTSLDGKNNYTNMAYVNNTAVTINYSSVDDSPSGTNHIVGNVYGGADNGSVNNSTSVTITRGRIGSDGDKDLGSLEGNVFGSGRGEDTYRTYRPGTSTEIDTISPFAGGTYGNTSVLINGKTRDSVQVMHHVYGGGANASVGDYACAAAAVGSGLDETLAKGEVYLLTNANSPSTHPAATDTAGTCKVTVTGGTIGTSGRNNGMIFGASRGDIGAPGSIYDSIAYVNKTIVTIGGGTNSSTDLNDFNPLINGSIYGGGENGHTVADAYVYIHDGRVGNHGDMYDRTKTLEDSIETLQKWVKEHSENAHKDDTLAKIEAFTTEMNSKLDFLSLCGNIYGGGCGTDKYIDIDDDNKEKYNSFAGVVFGNATILMDGGYVEHNIYGGGAMANLGRRVGAYVEHTDPETTFALSWPAEIHCRKNTGVARVTVSGSARLGYSGKDNGDIFGASRGEAGVPRSMTKFANVDSTVVLVNITDHAGKSDAQYYGDPTTGQLGVNPKNDHTTPLVAGSVYGGAENGHVIRSTNVRMQAGIVGHSIYGGGKGKGKYLETNLRKHDDSGDSSAMIYSLTAGRVYNNTYVTMTGGRVLRSVYGGGNMASVGKGNYAGGPGAWQGRGYGENWVDSNKTKLTGILAKTGHTLVYITGGTVGILDPSKPKNSFKDDLPLGNVFGGCRGEAAPVSSKSPRHLYSPGYFSGYTNHTRVIIGDSTISPVATPTSTSPRIYGSVYGGGQDGHVRNKTVVIINDAEIGVPYVSPSEASTLVGVDDISDMHWLGRGNVFGAGSGIGQYDSDGDGEADTYNDASGSVTDSTLIVINGGLIHQNVYGGGALASIGPMILPSDTDKTPDSTWSMARVFVKGGTIGTAGDCSGMYISGTDTTVFGNYGGNVYGAGRGFASDTYKNFNNTHHTHIHASGGTINGDVYGGAEDGHVISNTWVDISGTVTIGYNGLDNFNGNIFGGGRGSGSFATPGDASTYTMNVTCGRVGGNTNLTVDGNAVILGSLFGGGRTALTGVNADGELDATFFTEGNYDSVNHGYAYVIVKGSPAIGNPNGAALLSTDYSCGDIFGSGKGDIECYNDVRAGRVMNDSIHISETPRIYGAVFGGGEMAGVGWWDNTNLYTPLASGFAPSTGTTKVTVAGNATIGTEYEYTKDYLDHHGAWTVVTDGKLTHACTGNIVGASQGDVAPESPHWISMGRSRQSYVDISGTGTIMGNVYGGAEQGVVLENTDVRVSGCTIGTRIVNPNADVNKAQYISDSTDWKRDSAYLVSLWIIDSASSVSAWETEHAAWETEHEAWETAHAAWDPSSGDEEPIEPIDEPIKPTRPTAPVPVDTNNYLYYFGSVFGGGYGREETPRHYNDSCIINTITNIGTEQDPVYDTTYIKFVEATLIAGRTYGNTTVRISDSAIVRENVYGGGNMASVGYVREDANHKYNLIDSSYRQTNGVHTNGICTVNISGGIIGPNDHTQMNGHVYGGGKGVGNDPDEYFKNYCNVHETHLTVSGGHIYGSTFGGGADGHVLGHTHTTIEEGAYIGSGEDTQEYDGCVWGGGRNALNINHTAGRVQGHTSVTVTGGRIRRTVQGGGALARTGVDTNGVVECFLTGGTAANGAPIYDSTHHGNTYIYVTAGEPDVRDAVLKNGKDYDGRAVLAADMTTDEKKERNKNFIYFFADDADSTTYKDYLGTTEVRKVNGEYKIIVYKTAIGAYDGAVLVDNDYTIGDIFGGGKGDTKDTVDILAGRVMNTSVRIDGYPRIMADIYAGGEMSSVGWWDTNRYVGTYGSSDRNARHDKYYGNTGYTRLVIDGEPYTGTPYEFSSSCIHYGRPWTLIDSLGRLYHTCSGNVYGGGQGYVEQDGTHYWNWVHMGRVRNTSVEVNGGRFMGNCFGGGARGVVKEDCHVTVTGGCFGNIIYDKPEGFPKDHYYYGSVFGGGYGNHKRFSHISDSSFLCDTGYVRMVPTEQAGRVYGNTYVTITGGQIMDCVYGGGDMASTGWVERRQSDGAYLLNDPTKRHGGVCNVEISGNTIVGPLDYNGHNAYVYAAGRGIGHDSIEYSKKFCNVNEAHLTVHLREGAAADLPSKRPNQWDTTTMGGRIWGSLFGGGADSHVLDSVSVVVHSGIVGTQGTTSFDGNIFGGGRNYLNTNHTNGRVQGNIRVLMDGGTIQGTIFGGGRMALSGVDVDGHYIDSTHGNVNILVRGNATIGNYKADSLLFADESCGDIFGSGKGDIKNYEDIWAGRVTNAKITVKDTVISGNTYSPRIYGSIFGGGEMASLGYWDDTIKNGDDIIFYTTSDEGTNYGVIYENTGRAVIKLSGNIIVGTPKEYTVNSNENHSDRTIYNQWGKLVHTRTGNVFGGSQGSVNIGKPRWVSMGRSRQADITIDGAKVLSCVFGGSEQGMVTENTHVKILDGVIGTHVTNGNYNFGDVYAAGYGSDNAAENNDSTANDSTTARTGLSFSWTPLTMAGRVFGNSRVDIVGDTIRGSVYGGGNFASVGYEGNENSGHTYVNIGLPGADPEDKRQATGRATIKGEVFGANNLSGTPFGNTNVNIYKTAHTVADTCPSNAYAMALAAPDDELNGADVEHLPTAAEYFAISAVYGGGNRAAHQPLASTGTTLVHVWYCEENTIRSLYGGGNAANTKNNHLVVDGGRIYEVFGGGNGYGNHADPSAEDYNPGANVSGTATSDITGGLITNVYGGSNQLGTIETIVQNINREGDCPVATGNVFSGGNEAPTGNIITTLNCGASGTNFYAGGRNADVNGNVVLNIEGGRYTNVFGGSLGNVTNPANIKGDVTINVFGGNITNLYGGSDTNGYIEGRITINVDIDSTYDCADGLKLTNIYGAGNLAIYTPTDSNIASPVINIISDSAFLIRTSGLTELDPLDPLPYGFALHERSSVSAPDTLTKTFGLTNIYGGGYGDGTNGIVVGETTHTPHRDTLNGYVRANPVVNIGGIDKKWSKSITVQGALVKDLHRRNIAIVRGNVYGGGEAAPVKGNTEVTLYSSRAKIQSIDATDPEHPDTTFVTATSHHDTTHVKGYIFGGGFGRTAVVDGSTSVGIFGDATVVDGSVYGGGNAGVVTGNTDVQVGYELKRNVSQPYVHVNPDNSIVFSSATSGVSYYYTLDGSRPTTESTLYDPGTPPYADAGQTVRVIATKFGQKNSYPSDGTVVPLPAPSITITANTATITNTTAHGQTGVTLYYTTDGSAPNPGETGTFQYTGPIVSLAAGVTVKAIAVKDGYHNSPVASKKNE